MERDYEGKLFLKLHLDMVRHIRRRELGEKRHPFPVVFDYLQRVEPEVLEQLTGETRPRDAARELTRGDTFRDPKKL